VASSTQAATRNRIARRSNGSSREICRGQCFSVDDAEPFLGGRSARRRYGETPCRFAGWVAADSESEVPSGRVIRGFATSSHRGRIGPLSILQTNGKHKS